MTLPGAPDRVALLDEGVVAEEHDADVVLLEVQREAGDVVGQLEHLERHARLEAVDAGDAVADLEDAPDLLDVHGARVLLDLAPEDLGDLVGSELHLGRRPLCSGRWSCGQDAADGGVRRARPRRLAAQLVDAVADRAVHDDPADAQHQAADDRRGRPTRSARRSRRSWPAMRSTMRSRRSSGSGTAVMASTSSRASARATRSREGLGDLRELGDAAPVDEHLEEVRGERVGVGAQRPSRAAFLARVSISGFSRATAAGRPTPGRPRRTPATSAATCVNASASSAASNRASA